MAMSLNSISVIEYLQAHANEDLTAADVAADMGLEKRQVDGIFTSALCRKGLGVRVPAEVENEDHTHTAIKLLKLTEAGMNWTKDSVDAE